MNEEFNIEEFKNFIEDTKTKIEEYKEQVIRIPEDIIEGIPNIEFIFRMDFIRDKFNEMIEFLNREN